MMDDALHIIFDSGIGPRSAMAPGQYKRSHAQFQSTELNRVVGGFARRLQNPNKVV